MPRVRRAERWEHRHAPEGFVGRERPGDDAAFVYIFADGVRWRKALRPLRFIAAHKSAALTALVNLTRAQAWRFPPARVRVYADGSIALPEESTLTAAAPSSMTVQELYDMYLHQRDSLIAQGELGKGSRDRLTQMWKHFFVGERDFYLADGKGILEHVLRRTLTLDLSDTTKSNLLGTLRSMFDYGARLDVMVKNPLPLVREIALRPAGSNGTDRPGHQRRAYTPDEYARLLAEARRQDPELALMIELYYHTGMRREEAATLRHIDAWRQEGKSDAELATLPHFVPGDYLYIRGKGTRGKPKWRVFDLEYPDDDGTPRAQWKRRTWEIVDELARIYAPKNRGYICRWAPDSLGNRIYKTIRDAGLPREGLDVHSLRYNALTYMKRELRRSDDWMDLAVGNSKRVREETYLAEATAEQMRQME